MEVEIIQSKHSLFSLCLIIPYYLINTNFMAEDTSTSISISILLSRKTVMKIFHNGFFYLIRIYFQLFGNWWKCWQF